jgi:catechol 2,3-dioxygenase-like lactoylglutathione lyase family enzyme
VQIDHVTVPVSSYAAGKSFYERTLRPLGFSLRLDWPDRQRAFLGLSGEPSSLWVGESSAAGSLDLSLKAESTAAVDAFHAAALAAGGRSELSPGVDAGRSTDCYAARVRDPDGNAIEAVFRARRAGAAEPRQLAA